VLANAAGPVSAYDIAEVLSRREDRRVPANSIYRILDLFVARNLALRVESSNAYVANPHPGCVHDCIFLICDACNKTTHVDNDLASNSVRKSAAASSFTPVRTIIEVRGRCVQCA
jgi:Fur family transcriptional regulator, zinc uptake regulator